MKNQILQLMLALLSPIAFLEGGWGMTDEKVQHAGMLWNRIYFDENSCHFNALIPSSTGMTYRSGWLNFTGKGWKESDYTIQSKYAFQYMPPDDLNGFVKMVEIVYPKHLVVPIDAEVLGAKYAVDLVPLHSSMKDYWRILSTDNRAIIMGTNDQDEGMRTYFFQNISFPSE